MRSRYSSVVRFALLLSVVVGFQTAGAQAAASVCKDGSNSAAEGRGACSGHGGVDAKATKKAQDAVKKELKAAQARKEAEVAKAKVVAAKADTKADRVSREAEATRVTCVDGSASAGGRGACSGHGGIAKSNPVQKQVAKAETKAARAEAKVQTAQAKVGNGSAEDHNPAGSIAKCNDGLYSHAKNRRGACGHHGGVASWI